MAHPTAKHTGFAVYCGPGPARDANETSHNVCNRRTVCVVTTSPVLECSDCAGRELTPSLPATDFTLKATHGSDFRLSQLRGKVVPLNFGYTFCPDVCPTLVELSQVRARLGDAAKRVQVAFITLDPERDTLEPLRLYTTAFDPSFIGLTGSDEQLAQVRKMYGVMSERQAVSGMRGHNGHHRWRNKNRVATVGAR